MLKNQCISVTDLRTNTKGCLASLDEDPKYIFVNNKPVAVILKVEDYESLICQPKLYEFGKDEVSAKLKAEALAAQKLSRADLINI